MNGALCLPELSTISLGAPESFIPPPIILAPTVFVKRHTRNRRPKPNKPASTNHLFSFVSEPEAYKKITTMTRPRRKTIEADGPLPTGNAFLLLAACTMSLPAPMGPSSSICGTVDTGGIGENGASGAFFCIFAFLSSTGMGMPASMGFVLMSFAVG
ncbi:Uncharacterised protein [uncultured archaeon]|nr:Uncharacterised protein [uncultured archaeon]